MGHIQLWPAHTSPVLDGWSGGKAFYTSPTKVSNDGMVGDWDEHCNSALVISRLCVIQILRYIACVSIKYQHLFFPYMNAHGWDFPSVHLLSEKHAKKKQMNRGIGPRRPTTTVRVKSGLFGRPAPIHSVHTYPLSRNLWRYDHPDFIVAFPRKRCRFQFQVLHQALTSEKFFDLCRHFGAAAVGMVPGMGRQMMTDRAWFG